MSDGVSLSKEIKLIDGAHQISVVNTVTNTCKSNLHQELRDISRWQ